jgi:hypothetical protein
MTMGLTNNWKETYERISALEERQPDLTVYTGEYWSKELETFLTILLRNGQLVLELRRHTENPLRYVARNIFGTGAKSDPWFKVKFQRDAGENVTGLRLNGYFFKRRAAE